MKEAMRVAGRKIELSNQDKVLFPDDGITKGDLVDYYRRIARRMQPHVEGRPVSMERYPNGIEGHRIFQKDAPEYFPSWIARVEMSKEGGTVNHVLIDGAATLAYLANQAFITLHVTLSRADDLRRPDQLMFDLDPVESFDDARHAALMLKPLLDELGLPSFVKTTGGKGLHVIVPLVPEEPFESVRPVAEEIGKVLVGRDPDRLTTEFRKAKREGRLFVDLTRNAYAQTAAVPFGVRARPGAPVATPLAWTEVEDRSLRPGRFTIRTVFDRVERVKDPWAGMRTRARTLEAARGRLAKLQRSE
jgi:bifunctional non-homologous end joining protein LigD